MNILALVAAIVCAVVALFYALPMIAVAIVVRFLGRRFGIRPPVFALAILRVRWVPVLLWGGASILLFIVAFTG